MVEPEGTLLTACEIVEYEIRCGWQLPTAYLVPANADALMSTVVITIAMNLSRNILHLPVRRDFDFTDCVLGLQNRPRCALRMGRNAGPRRVYMLVTHSTILCLPRPTSLSSLFDECVS